MKQPRSACFPAPAAAKAVMPRVRPVPTVEVTHQRPLASTDAGEWVEETQVFVVSPQGEMTLVSSSVAPCPPPEDRPMSPALPQRT